MANEVASLTMADKLREDERFRAAVRWAGIPPSTYWTHRYRTFVTVPGTEMAFEETLFFLGDQPRHHFILFGGLPGTGKTHLALSIGWYFLEVKRLMVKYYQVEALLDELRKGFNPSSREDLTLAAMGHLSESPDLDSMRDFDFKMRTLKKVPVLILDDLGAEQSTPWARAKLDEIIDHRYINKLRTVVTTNLAPSRLSSRIESRLSEGVVCLLDCPDWRKTKGRSKG